MECILRPAFWQADITFQMGGGRALSQKHTSNNQHIFLRIFCIHSQTNIYPASKSPSSGQKGRHKIQPLYTAEHLQKNANIEPEGSLVQQSIHSDPQVIEEGNEGTNQWRTGGQKD